MTTLEKKSLQIVQNIIDDLKGAVQNLPVNGKYEIDSRDDIVTNFVDAQEWIKAILDQK